MSEQGNKRILTKYIGAVKYFFGIATILFFLFFLIGEAVFPDERELIPDNCRVFETSWQRVLADGERIPVQVPGKMEAEYGEPVILITTLPKEINDGISLCFQPIWQDVEVYIGEELRYSYNTRETRPFGTNSAFRNIIVDLKSADAGKELTYCFTSDSKYTGYMQQVLIGNKVNMGILFMERSAMRVTTSFFMMLVSLFGFCVCVVIKMVYKKMPPLNYLCWAMFFGAFWLLSEVEIRQIIFKNVSIVANCTYWSLMLVVFPILLYINEIQKGYYRKILVFPLTYSVVVLVVGTILQVTDTVQFVHMLPFIHAGTFFAVLSILLTITVDTIKKRIKGYWLMAIGIYVTGIAVVVELILYYADSSIWLGTVSVFGLLILFFLTMISTVQELMQIEKNRQQAIDAKQAQAKFLANISHEIRTPINAVIGMNEMILRESDNEAVHEYAHNIKSASNMLLGLVNDVLDFSKIESEQLELVEATYEFASLIQDELAMLKARVGSKPLNIQTDIDPNMPVKLCGDELRIKQILTNLISNAVKYTKEGTIKVKASFQWIKEDTIQLCFSVSDTGIGIRKEDLPKLFDSFKRLELRRNQNIEGTGLGLTIAKQLVELMQGTITVESEYGKGSTFTVCFPQKVIDRSIIGNLDQLLKGYRKENEEKEGLFTAPDATVLVVDDNDMNRLLMKNLLKRTLIKVDLAAGGKECLRMTKQKKYHMILMDHMMPEIDGVETLQKIRTDSENPNQHVTVIALTANVSADSREMYLGYGFDDYFAKPVKVKNLENMLVSYLPHELVHMNTKEDA